MKRAHWLTTGGVLLFTAGLSSCVSTAAAPAPARPARREVSRSEVGPADGCTRDDEIFGPVRVSAAVYGSRTGVMARRFSELGTTTKESPLEECGLKTVVLRLISLRCDDGSKPFGDDFRAAHASRAGSFGPGGRCGSIIDRYDVPCPERTYQVFADGYVCPAGLGAD